MTQLSDILREYREKRRELPSYQELVEIDNLNSRTLTQIITFFDTLSKLEDLNDARTVINDVRDQLGSFV